jgi:glycosyltransferase involved in cell wall biosynthesis
MIIGIDASRAIAPQKTGVEWYVFFVIKALIPLVPASHEVRLYVDRPVEKVFGSLPRHWRVCVLRWPPKRLWTQCRLSFEMAVRPPDVLFVPAHVPPLIHPKKTLTMVHDVAAARYPHAYSWFERWYSLWSAQYAVHHLWRVIVPSAFVKGELVQLTEKESAPNSHIRVIHHGIDPAFFDATLGTREKVGKKYGISKPYVISVGRLETKKNTVALIHAFERVKEYHDLQLVLVGKPGYGYQAVRSAIEESSEARDIIQPGYVDQHDLPVLVRDARASMSVSLYEGFGMPAIEAIAVGTPVVASRGSSIEDIVGSCAFYAEDASPRAIARAVLAVLDNPDATALHIEQAKECRTQFTWDRCASQTLAVMLDR